MEKKLCPREDENIEKEVIVVYRGRSDEATKISEYDDLQIDAHR